MILTVVGNVMSGWFKRYDLIWSSLLAQAGRPNEFYVLDYPRLTHPTSPPSFIILRNSGSSVGRVSSG